MAAGDYWPGILLLIPAAGAWIILESASPLTCPHCQRFNAFSRKKTGLTFSDMDPDGQLIQNSQETLCKRCGQLYWITQDKFNGRCATKNLQRR